MNKNCFNSRFQSREITMGDLTMGGTAPVRIQSMTSTNTLDTDATVKQSIRMIQAGCELVRITASGIKEAENLANIKKTLQQQGYNIPLIADIHYMPKAAEIAAGIVEKVRINPGNYVDRANATKVSFTESEYQLELEKIADKLYPLLKICKQNNTAIRIGTNHGSLSSRITARYGDTPAGMVESAIEFVKICEQFHFHNIVLSMKSSNIKVMVHATRLLADRMLRENMEYPLHLGVTEAGNMEDGRIKSAIGIGMLLREGLGDTIRVSLTEDPELEIPVAKKIIQFSPKPEANKLIYSEALSPFEYNKRETNVVENIGRTSPVVVSSKKNSAADYLLDNINILEKEGKLNGLSVSENAINTNNPISPENKNPLILKGVYSGFSFENLLVKSSIDFGSFFINGLGDGMYIKSDLSEKQSIPLCFKIMQACGVRITSTEFISCPSCGRTKFDIQKALQNVKEATGHLVGLKIAVMGCVVNGPGEMADAHYGYVGAGSGKVNLYKSRTLVKKNICESDAVISLIDLIKENGDWKDPN